MALGDRLDHKVRTIPDIGQRPHQDRPERDRRQQVFRDRTPVQGDGRHVRGRRHGPGRLEKDGVGGGIVQHARQQPARPEELPRARHAEVRPSRLEDFQGDLHRQEDPEEQAGDFQDRAIRELDFLAKPFRGRRQRQARQREHRHLAGKRHDHDVGPRPSLAGFDQRDGRHDAQEPEDVDPPVQAQGARVGVAGVQGRQVLTRVSSAFPEIIDNQEGGDAEGPSFRQPERPEEGDAFEIAEEKGRVADRQEQSADVRGEEDEEDQRVPDVLASAVAPQERADQDHRRPGRADQARQHRPDRQDRQVDGRLRAKVAPKLNPSGDRIQAEQECHERDVFPQDGVFQHPEDRGKAGVLVMVPEPPGGIVTQDNGAQGHADEEFAAIALPPVRGVGDQRQGGDRQQEGDERQGPERMGRGHGRGRDLLGRNSRPQPNG